jgi:hypothetical protein
MKCVVIVKISNKRQLYKTHTKAEAQVYLRVLPLLEAACAPKKVSMQIVKQREVAW